MDTKSKWDIKYSFKDFKVDFITGALNGALFGLIYSFYYFPFEFKKENVASKFKNSKMLYYVSGSTRMALAFSLLRCTYSFTQKQQLGRQYQIGCTLLALGGITYFIL